MYALQSAKQEVLQALKGALGKGASPHIADLESPRSPDFGDVSFPCFTLSKILKRSPVELATEIAAKIGAKGFIAKAEAKGPYVNFWLSHEALAARVLKEIKTAKDKYGHSTHGAGKRVLVEYANLNTHKEVHVGHLRNLSLGAAVVEILAAAGYEAIPVSYINDLGNNVARCLWGYKKFYPDKKIEPATVNTFLGEVYTKATRALEEDEAARVEVSVVQRELEEGKGEWAKLWKQTNKASLAGLKVAFKDYGLRLEKIYLESQNLKETKRIVQDLIKKGIAVHSEGAWVVRLEDEGLGVSILVKTDGTHLYNAKDLALAARKERDYHPDRSVIVLDVRQSLPMQQLFATLRLMGFQKEFIHLSFGHVSLPEGAMSSRKGNFIRYEDVMRQMIDLATVETRTRHTNWKDKKINSVARKLAYGAVKFSMLRVDPDKPVVFDMKEALSFDGYHAPYLFYTLARCRGILDKQSKKMDHLSHVPKSSAEEELVRLLAHYPEVILEVAMDYQISRLTQFLFTLGQAFSRWYAEAPILAEEDLKLRARRLSVVEAVSQVMKNGVHLLGMEPLEEM
ncbi:arginine--tRNA ligase [Candidatus Uhrbacteria bacterium]|nr:arginine--tRNA ligase [Candidatus Uhrbacteria bacterium]